MSKEDVKIQELVRYRVVGGPVDVDQRLTVFDDGAVELDERHRSRDVIRLRLDAAELGQLRAALEQIPGSVWDSGLPRFALGRVKRALIRPWTVFVPRSPERSYELRRGRKAIVGARVDIGDYVYISTLVAALDELRARAVRAEPR